MSSGAHIAGTPGMFLAPGCPKSQRVSPATKPGQFSATSGVPSTKATETARTARGELSTFAKANILLGAMIVSLFSNPTALLFQKLTGGMYGPVFRHHSPALFIATIISICVVTSGLLIWFVVRKWLFLERLEVTYKSTGWFILGNVLILIYLPIRVFASTLQGGGDPSLAVAVIGAVPVTVAKVCLGIGLIRVLIGIEPIRRA